MVSVSVAMATYNGRCHIVRQLASLAAQSLRPDELVVTDDASTDDTLGIVEAFAKTAPFPVHVHRNDTRLGYRANFMRAASMCRSELIAFCDQDDYWYPHKIAAAVAPFADPEVLLTYHNADTVTEDGTRLGTLTNRAAPRPILEPLSSEPWQFALGFTEVFRQSLMRLSHLWPRTLNIWTKTKQDREEQLLGHDQWIFFLASVFGRIAYLDEPLAAYVQHANNLYGSGQDNFATRARRVFRDRCDEYHRVAKAADNQAAILDTAAGELGGVWAARAAAGSEHYRTVAWLYARRQTIYGAANVSDRLSAFRAIRGKNGYAGRWGLGQKALVTDACMGVIPIGPLMRSSPG